MDSAAARLLATAEIRRCPGPIQQTGKEGGGRLGGGVCVIVFSFFLVCVFFLVVFFGWGRVGYFCLNWGVICLFSFFFEGNVLGCVFLVFSIYVFLFFVVHQFVVFHFHFFSYGCLGYVCAVLSLRFCCRCFRGFPGSAW